VICHIEPMQLRVKQVCQAVVVLLCAAHNSRCSIHDLLQRVGNRLWCSGQQQIAIVDHTNRAIVLGGGNAVTSIRQARRAAAVN